MMRKIAALTCSGVLSSLEECTEVLLFENEGSSWGIIGRLPFRLEGRKPNEIRDSVRSLVLKLDCKVVVARTISGIPYHVFDTTGFSIFEAENLSDRLLYDILRDISMAQNQVLSEQTATEPIPIDEEGRWFLDLISLQERHPEISSKKALRPFLQNQAFLELKLLCTHLPPWLDVELPPRHLGCTIENDPDGRIMVSISHTLCKE